MKLSVTNILAMHDRPAPDGSSDAATPAAAAGTPDDLAALVEAAHLANVAIWRLEDQARRRDVADSRIAAIKRAIDPWNQRRNDLMEQVDASILAEHANVDVRNAELHSETAGMIIDRLSILALKIRGFEAIAAAAERDGDASLAGECRWKSHVLGEQRSDLAGCLERLLEDFAAGRRYFRTYRQMKAYNDDRLNPALRAAAAGSKETQ